MIYIMITSCQKYNHKLDFHRNFIKKHKSILNQHNVEMIIIMGGQPDPNISDVVFLDAPDDYKNLPKKVYEGFRYIYENKPDVEAIVKIDDDVHISPCAIINLRHVSWIPYWGLQLGHIFVDNTVFPVYHRFDDPNVEVIPLKKCIHPIGHVYSLNKHAIELLLKHKKEMYYGYHEDAMVGKILNDYNIFPVKIEKLESLFKLVE